ncbi:hypothetical protein [Nonomuraea sp. NPDC003201]
MAVLENADSFGSDSRKQWLIDPRRDLVAAMTAALQDLLGPRT